MPTPPQPDPTETELLVGYVRTALERIAAGEAVDPATLCRAHPHLVAPLAEALGLGEALAQLDPDAVRSDPLAGHLLGGRYRLEQCLGRGAMGVVYRAQDQELHRAVAVKILDARLFTDPVAEQRFQREAETLAALQHPAIVPVFDRGRTAEGIHFLVMELLDGAPLSAVLQRISEHDDEAPVAAVAAVAGAGSGRESSWWRLCARWGAELAAGLHAAHQAGIVHRDVKPSNAFVRADGRAVLLDFGIAAREADARLTATATTLGTPWYMAPEQVAAGGGPAGPTLDVYGLCASLYHLLSGQPPYQGDPAQVLVALAQRDPLPLRQLRRGLPVDLAAIVERGIERDPSRRYPTAAALAADLHAFLEHQPVQARPIGWLGRRWRSARRSPARALAVLASAIALTLLAVAAPLWANQRARQRAEQKAQLAATLPVLLAVEGQPRQRLVEALLPDQQEVMRLLDQLVELDGADLPVRLFRAAMHLDRGEPRLAADDLRAIATNHRSHYLAELARRYAAAQADHKGTEAVDLVGLPEPDGPDAAFVAGFHELRNRHVDGFAERAERWLRAAGNHVPARDLRTIALLAMTDGLGDARRRRELFQEAHDETLRLEEAYGRPTARTLAVRGAALVGLRRYEDAVPVLEHSLQLRPDRHSPLINLGIALRRLNRPDAAARVLEQAHAVRPDYWNTCYTLAQLALDRGDLAAARQWASRVPSSGPGGLDWLHPDLLATIDLAEAMLNRRSDETAMQAAATRAVQHYDEALAAVTRAGDRQRLQTRRQVAQSLLAADLDQALIGLLNLVQLEPTNPYQIANVAGLLAADGLGPDATAWIGIYLRRLAATLAEGDAALSARLQGEIQAIVQSLSR